MAIKGWIDLQHTHVDVAFACWNVLLLIKKCDSDTRMLKMNPPKIF